MRCPRSIPWSRLPRARALLPLLAVAMAAAGGEAPAGSDLREILRLRPASRAIGTGGADSSRLEVSLFWRGDRCQPVVRNTGAEAVRVREVVLGDIAHGLPGDTPFYGEGFQMLSQTGGTLAQPRDIGEYTDRGHYRLPESEGFRTVYGMLLLSPAEGPRQILGFTSCHRFNGKFLVNAERLRIVVETEDLTLDPGQSWFLEEWLVASSPDREALLERLSAALGRQHPPIFRDPVPSGWCSWYCFGPRVTARQITDNLEWIAAHLPDLKYIQIDDGYQPWMGDWLDTGKAFGGDLRGVLRQIRDRGFEPALWVAPFIASEQSSLFREHPEWFVQDEEGRPLRSDRVGFGGWRLGPWYALDGTHPEALRWLEELFRTLRAEWGCTYFKLDANYWGTLPGGRRHDPRATRIEAYRRGMEAIRRGAGDALLLGCNHPMWPSLGLVHASRSSLDIGRSWSAFASIGRENLLRGWQNGRLWWNDPDCVLLHDDQSRDGVDSSGRPTTAGAQPDNEYLFHATLTYATGGMVLSGDDLTRITPRRRDFLARLLPPSGRCARFADDRFEVGVTELPEGDMFSVFNWGGEPVTRVLRLRSRSRLTDHFTGEDLGVREGEVRLEGVPPRSGRLILARPLVP